MSLALPGAAIVLFSILGWWRPNWRPSALMFMIAAGVSITMGLQWFETYTSNMGLTMGLMLIAYSFVCIGMALNALLSVPGTGDDDG